MTARNKGKVEGRENIAKPFGLPPLSLVSRRVRRVDSINTIESSRVLKKCASIESSRVEFFLIYLFASTYSFVLFPRKINKHGRHLQHTSGWTWPAGKRPVAQGEQQRQQ